MSVSCECRELSGRGLCEGLIPRPDDFYRVRARARVCVCVRARVSLSVIKCKNDLLLLRRVGRRGQNRKERMKDL